MKKTILTFLIFATTTRCFGQTTETKYFNSEWAGKEVPQEKAKFSRTIIQNTDGTVTTEIKDLKQDEVVRRETFKGNEPYGIWKHRHGNGYSTLDYGFPLVYSTESCTDTLPIKTGDLFRDNDSLNYKAPKILTGELTINQFLGKHTIYPNRAKEEGIQGTVYLMLTLTKDGTIENVVVKRGVNILLDKEAARVIRQLKFNSPPTLNGQAYTFNCLVLPMKFSLR